MNNTMTNWTELNVTDGDGMVSNLGELVRCAPANLDSAVITEGRIAQWDGFLIAAPGEDAEYDTPRVAVDWDGFENALKSMTA